MPQKVVYYTTGKYKAYKCDTGAQNSSIVVFSYFDLIIFHNASTSACLLHTQNILFLTEIKLNWLQS